MLESMKIVRIKLEKIISLITKKKFFTANASARVNGENTNTRQRSENNLNETSIKNQNGNECDPNNKNNKTNYFNSDPRFFDSHDKHQKKFFTSMKSSSGLFNLYSFPVIFIL